MKRVVVTGMSGISPIGSDWESIEKNLRAKSNGISHMPAWDRYTDLNTRLAGPVLDFEPSPNFTRRLTRSMGRVSLMAVTATERAMESAGLLNDQTIQDGRMGVSYGSSTGSTDAVSDFGNMLLSGDCSGLNANTYIKMMGHTAPVNIGVYFKLKGRVITTSSACTSASQGIGYASEAIKFGKQQLMVAGGGEELCPTEAAVFDTLFATSTRNDTPELTPRPFDRDRDGLVIGEGAGTLILEELEHAEQRGATIYAELVGYGSNSDGTHVTQPQPATMRKVMELSLEDANLKPEDIAYISAHGTATSRGDAAESQATAELFGSNTPISTLKSYTGHTLGACGALEAWVGIEMMRRGWFHPTINLDNVDEGCADLDYIVGDGRQIDAPYIMSNNFAFGGINTSLIFKKWD